MKYKTKQKYPYKKETIDEKRKHTKEEARGNYLKQRKGGVIRREIKRTDGDEEEEGEKDGLKGE